MEKFYKWGIEVCDTITIMAAIETGVRLVDYPTMMLYAVTVLAVVIETMM